MAQNKGAIVHFPPPSVGRDGLNRFIQYAGGAVSMPHNTNING